jgi:hypothetical protein
MSLSYNTAVPHGFVSGELIMKNPDLREYALFALRNLLHNNSENQAVVDTFQADEHVGPTVVVPDLLGGAK